MLDFDALIRATDHARVTIHLHPTHATDAAGLDIAITAWTGHNRRSTILQRIPREHRNAPEMIGKAILDGLARFAHDHDVRDPATMTNAEQRETDRIARGDFWPPSREQRPPSTPATE